MKRVNFIWLLVSQFIFLFPAFAEKNPACPAPHELNRNLMNAVGIKSFIQSNGIKDIGDFICCLPKDFRENYVVTHSSIAAQNSNYKSPRILFFSAEEETGNARTILSVNGGAKDLNQTSNIEILSDNSQTREVELYDIEVRPKGPVLSERNPPLCMSCHGDYGIAGVGGPHPNFEPSLSWKRFIGGSFTCNETEQKYHKLLDQKAIQAIQENPRFKCLGKNNSTGPFDAGNFLSTLDNRLDILNSRRVAKIIRSTPEYERFKYAIIGSNLCVNRGGPKLKISEWVPEKILKKMSHDSFLTKNLQSSVSLKNGLANEISHLKEADQKSTAQMLAAIEKIKIGEIPEFLSSPSNFLTCVNHLTPGSLVQGLGSGNELLDRYILDRRIKGSLDGFTRFLFETRGIDTGTWEMSLLPNSNIRDLGQFAHELLRLEKEPGLKDISDKLFQLGLSRDADGLKNPTGTAGQVNTFPIIDKYLDEACLYLQQKSLAALTDLATNEVPEAAPVLEKNAE